MSLSDVSRETDAKDFPPTGAQSTVSRRQLPRERIERRGRWARVGPAWSAEDLATLRQLVEGGCITKDIALHFKSTPQAISALMHRHRILRRHPSVAEVLQSSTPAAGGSESVREPAHQASGAEPEPSAVLIPTVMLLDRFERYVGMVEMHEVYNGMARIRHVAGAHGHAGKWLTVPVLQLRFDRTQDRAALLEQARERAAASEARRKAQHQQSSNNGESDNA